MCEGVECFPRIGNEPIFMQFKFWLVLSFPSSYNKQDRIVFSSNYGRNALRKNLFVRVSAS